MSFEIINDVSCPACQVDPGVLCTVPVPPRVVRVCSNRVQHFIEHGSLKARIAVHNQFAEDAESKGMTVKAAPYLSPEEFEALL